MAKTMTIKVAHLARKLQTICIKSKSSVKDVLAKLEMEARGDIFVNGKRAGLRTVLKEGDILGIVGQVEGGR